MSSCPELNGPSFRSEWGFTEAAFGYDLARLSPVCDLLFGSVESLEVRTSPCFPHPRIVHTVYRK